MLKEFKTVSEDAVAEITEKKSRFIASVSQTDTEEAALEFVKGIKAKYHDAAHNVYVYYIENGNCIQKYSDDGEPQGTAGLPVLDVIKKLELRNITVVVTRYFGGTLLGKGGLVRAYSRSALKAISEATIVRKKLCFTVNASVEYASYGKIKNRLFEGGYVIDKINYGKYVQIIVFIPMDDIDGFTALFAELTNGRGFVEVLGKNNITVAI